MSERVTTVEVLREEIEAGLAWSATPEQQGSGFTVEIAAGFKMPSDTDLSQLTAGRTWSYNTKYKNGVEFILLIIEAE